ncbi:hypothetical protein Hanom_Chr03g00197521 [Helianthus anomalus]
MWVGLDLKSLIPHDIFPNLGFRVEKQFDLKIDGGSHGYGNGTYKGVHLHQSRRWHAFTGKGHVHHEASNLLLG